MDINLQKQMLLISSHKSAEARTARQDDLGNRSCYNNDLANLGLSPTQTERM